MTINVNAQTIDYIIASFPVLVLCFVMFKKRAAIWKCRSSILTATTVIMVLLSLSYSSYRFLIPHKKASQTISKETTNTVKAEKEFDWGAYYMPGGWGKLYKEIKYCRFYDAKFLAIENFLKIDAKAEPKLTAQGYNAFCFEFLVPNDDNGSNAQIAKLHTLLKDFVQSIPEAERNYDEKRHNFLLEQAEASEKITESIKKFAEENKKTATTLPSK